MTVSSVNENTNQKTISSTMNSFLILNAIFTAFMLFIGLEFSLNMIPASEEMFSSFGSNLPSLTQFVFDYSLILVSFVVVLSAGFCVVLKTKYFESIILEKGKKIAKILTVIHVLSLIAFIYFLNFVNYLPMKQMG